MTTSEKAKPPVRIECPDYRREYGGVPVLIGGDECSFGSVVGYSLYSRWCPVEAVQRALKLGHKLHWISRAAGVICSDPGYYEQQRARREQMPKLSVGDIVEYEGCPFRIVHAPNNNYDLEPVKGVVLP